MSHRRVATVAALSSITAAGPAVATAQTPQPTVTPGSTSAHAAQRSIQLSQRRLDATVGRTVGVTGHVRGGSGLQVVRLQVRRPGRWATIDRARTATGGAFRLRDRRHATMSAPVRVTAPAGRGLARAVKAAGRVDVYRVAHASWYGPGLYGNHLGCGGTLTAGTLGVANKSLPCGTKVTLRHGGRSVRVAVVDRGPYVAGREYDLTAATAQRIGFSGHGAIQVTR